MKELETGRDKIQKICDVLRKETLEPAQQEAREIVENAHLQAEQIVEEAQKKAEGIVREAEREIEQKKRVAEASLQLACRQGIERLKQRIEEELFHKELVQAIEKEMADPKTIAHLIEAFVRATAEGEELVAILPKKISPRAVTAFLASYVLERLRDQVLSLGDFAGGVQIRLEEKKVRIDMSSAALQELIIPYLRLDLRDLVFGT